MQNRVYLLDYSSVVKESIKLSSSICPIQFSLLITNMFLFMYCPFFVRNMYVIDRPFENIFHYSCGLLVIQKYPQ